MSPKTEENLPEPRHERTSPDADPGKKLESDENSLKDGKNTNHLLADAIDFLPDATLAIDMEGKVIKWNRAMEALTGVKARDMLGKGNYEYALPFYGTRRPILADLVLMPEEQLQGKYDSIHRDGKTFTVEIFIPTFGQKGSYLWAKASPLYDVDGGLAGAIESIRDITERKRIEEALLKSEQEKEAILSGLRNVAVEYLDPQMRIIWVNSAVQRSTGLSMDALRDRFCYEVIQGLKEPCPGCKAVETLQDGESHEGELATPDGKSWAARSNPIMGADGEIKGVVHVAVNITKIKHAEQKVCSMKQRLAQVIDFLPDATFAIDVGAESPLGTGLWKLTGMKAEKSIAKETMSTLCLSTVPGGLSWRTWSCCPRSSFMASMIAYRWTERPSPWRSSYPPSAPGGLTFGQKPRRYTIHRETWPGQSSQ
jgi:PAS domain S-box-containing protein